MNDEIAELDVTGLPCPLPVVKLKKLLANLDSNVEKIYLKATDKGSIRDIPAFCKLYQLDCLLMQESPVILFEIAPSK